MQKYSQHPFDERGSALLVTMMIVGISTLFVILLLERIVPYAQQIGGIQDAAQAYYNAKGQVELAKNTLKNYSPRENIDTDPARIASAGRTIILAPPHVSVKKTGEFVIIAGHVMLPLQIRLFEKDTSPQNFGTSQQDPAFHNFSTYGGGIFLDLSQKNTASPAFSLVFSSQTPSTLGNIRTEFLFTNGKTTVPFFGIVGSKGTPSVLEGKDIAKAKDINKPAGKDTLADLLKNYNCRNGDCSLKLALIDASAATSIPVSLQSSVFLPDLNAVIVADGLSKNGAYHSRILELAPLVQSI